MAIGAPTGSGWARFGGGADALMLRELDATHQSSGEPGDGQGGFAPDLAVGDVGQEASDSCAEIVGSDVICREGK